jgi:hypothetical protein
MEEIEEIIEGFRKAGRPSVKVRAELYDYKSKLRVKVESSAGATLWELSGVSTRLLRDYSECEDILRQIKNAIAREFAQVNVRG